MVINKFRGNYNFLSNMYSCDVIWNNHLFPSVENAYQALKWGSGEYFEKCKNISAVEAKKLGKFARLSEDWYDMNKYFMYCLVYDKFTRNPELREKLIATGDAIIVEGNTWHDNFWGDCKCTKCQNKIGQNHLGKILMRVRDEI